MTLFRRLEGLITSCVLQVTCKVKLHPDGIFIKVLPDLRRFRSDQIIQNMIGSLRTFERTNQQHQQQFCKDWRNQEKF